MNTELEKLIELALVDGVLTEKEKAVLLKKAIELNVDIDEFEMILDAKLHILKNKEETTKNSNQNRAEKCPSCGGLLKSMDLKCEQCGYDIKNLDSNSSIQKLFALLQEAEFKRHNNNSNRFIVNLFAGGLDNIDKMKLEIISSFPIPNTKEDILEFLSLAVPKTKIKKSLFGLLESQDNIKPNTFARVWKEKCEQLIMKARFSMKDDKNCLNQIEHYAKMINSK